LLLQVDARQLRTTLAAYQAPSRARSLLELALTAAPLLATWALLYLSVAREMWWGLVLAVPAALLLVRLFMIQHDCGHHAFFRSAAANTWLGRVIGVLTMTPYDYWRRTHAIHHATSGNLDRRGLGGVELLTVGEYRALPWVRRLGYRLYRHPLVMLGLGPAYMFLLQHRLPIGVMRQGWAWRSVLGHNLGLALLVALLMAWVGPRTFLIAHLPVVVMAATFGVGLFYVQHQFERGYWARNAAWNPAVAAILGSSHLRLPGPLQWLTANIGAHHVHHASSKIPFYRLPEVVRREPVFEAAPRLGLREAIGAMGLALWDEDAKRLVTFREATAGSRPPPGPPPRRAGQPAR
jgi:omega-6 fatty acid desaturase (delta-12 desaturase)